MDYPRTEQQDSSLPSQLFKLYLRGALHSERMGRKPQFRQ